MDKNEVITIIKRLCAEEGMDGDCFVRMAEIESNLNPYARNAKNPDVEGLWQISRKYHNFCCSFDAWESTRWAIRYAKANHEFLRQNNIPVNCVTTYLAHQQGKGGIKTLWDAARAGKTIAELPSDIRRNVLANTGGRNFTTVAEFLAFWERNVSRRNTIFTQMELAGVTPIHAIALGALALSALATAAITRFKEGKK